MGYGAIRIFLKQPKVFKKQIQALLRAAAFGNLSIMYHMITSVEETQKIYEIVRESQAELEKAGIPYKVSEQGSSYD